MGAIPFHKELGCLVNYCCKLKFKLHLSQILRARLDPVYYSIEEKRKSGPIKAPCCTTTQPLPNAHLHMNGSHLHSTPEMCQPLPCE